MSDTTTSEWADLSAAVDKLREDFEAGIAKTLNMLGVLTDDEADG